MSRITFEQVFEAVENTVKLHPCSDFGNRPYQIIGICYDSDRSIWYSAVEIKGQNNFVYFRINDQNGGNNKKLHLEKIDYYVPGSFAPYTTWINPNYTPFSDFQITHLKMKDLESVEAGLLSGKCTLTLPDGSEIEGELKIEIQTIA